MLVGHLACKNSCIQSLLSGISLTWSNIGQVGRSNKNWMYGHVQVLHAWQ